VRCSGHRRLYRGENRITLADATGNVFGQSGANLEALSDILALG
jgi:hypothetical protein